MEDFLLKRFLHASPEIPLNPKMESLLFNPFFISYEARNQAGITRFRARARNSLNGFNYPQ